MLEDKWKSLLESVSVRNVAAVLYGGPEVQKLNNDQTETGKLFAAVLFSSTMTMTKLFCWRPFFYGDNETSLLSTLSACCCSRKLGTVATFKLKAPPQRTRF